MNTDNKKRITVKLGKTNFLKSLGIALVLVFLMYVLKFSPVQMIRQYKVVFEYIISFCSLIIIGDSVLNSRFSKYRVIKDLDEDVNNTLDNLKVLEKVEVNHIYVNNLLSKLLLSVAICSFAFVVITMLIAYNSFNNAVMLVMVCSWVTLLIYVVYELFNITGALIVIYLLNKHSDKE